LQRQIHKLAVSIATCLTISLPAHAASIGGIGVQYDRMPLGTQVHYKDNEGYTWTDVFIGKKGGKYVVKRYNKKKTSGRVRSERIFDAKGRLLSYTGYGDRAHKYKLSFSPYLCEYQLGNCKTKRRFRGSTYVADGSSESWGAKTEKTSSGYRTIYSKIKTGSLYGARFFKLGKYNLRTYDQWGRGKGKSIIKIISIK